VKIDIESQEAKVNTDSRRAPLADQTAVAAFLGVPTGTLVRWRYCGEGPRWRKVGKHIRYDWPGVEQWLADQPGGDGDSASAVLRTPAGQRTSTVRQ